MSQLTTTRQAIAAALAGYGSLPPAAAWVDGQIEPPVERDDLGCTWIASTREVSGNVSVEEVTVVVRVLSATQRGRGARRPLDPAKLETWRDEIALKLSQVQTQLGGWYLRVTGSSIDPRVGRVDVSVAVWQDNVFKSV